MKKIVKNAAILASLLICCWCIYMKAGDWIKSSGADALLFAAGITSEEEKTGMKPEAAQINQSEEGEPREGNIVLLENDGIVPFHQDEFPVISETPDPNRESLPVEEIQATGGTKVDNFYVKDSTGSGTDLAAELLNDPAVSIRANGDVEVLIYHTHTSEAYMEAYSGFYYTDMQTRSSNQDSSVVAVGEEIKKELEKAGIGVVHDTSVNDTMFNGSYSRSWEVLQKNLEEYPTIQITIDIHRDSMTTEEGVKYKPTASIDGRKAAQVMILAGCDADGGWGDFPDWRDNLHMALRLQQRASELYPELMRPMTFSNSKYNMNATRGSMLIEVGTEVNTVSEAKYSGKLVGQILSSLLTEMAQENQDGE